MALILRTERKTQPAYDADPRAKAIDELQRISGDHRDKFLGQNWFPQVRDFYNLAGAGRTTPSFRPRISIPQLQVMNISEATELSDSSPKVYIYNRESGDVDDDRTRAFDEQWRRAWVNYYLLHGLLWSQLSSIGFIQVGYDPTACYGQGEVWARHRDPETVYVDPGATSDEDWQYLVFEDRYYPDQQEEFWPETGRDMEAEPYMPGSYRSPEGFGFRLPEGPMSVTSGPVGGEVRHGDGRNRTRTIFLSDHTIEVTRDEAGGDSAAVVENGMGVPKGSVKRMPRYPNKRMVVESNGRILADGDNPNPKRRFPLVPIYALPPLTDFYPPPPSRFSKDLQDLAGRMLTQTYENAVRLNNGVWFIPEESGITAEAFGGLPGEVQIMQPNSRPPVQVWPNQMPQHMVQLPQYLLALQKELQGITPSREGQPGPGNISPELFEASLYQSKTITRCRERLLARSVHRLAEQIFDLMVVNYKGRRAFPTVNENFTTIPWLPLADNNQLGLYIDPTSLMPISRSAMRQMAIPLREAGALDVQSFLEYLEVPNAAEVAQKMNREMQLAALSKSRKR
jgi:hypothetical protein